ncbi:MAG: hypothetical protein FJ100_10475 [Deltaproteobacteria bacterium]|nr:hypothetical protein [Deltaproteobacteria bacterium]
MKINDYARSAAAALALTLLAAPAWSAPAPAEAPKAPTAEPAADTAGPEAVVLRALAAGMAGKFDAYLAELHPDRKETADQKSQLQRYEWKRFSGQAAWYVADPSKPTVQVARKQTLSPSKVKLFIKDLKNKDSMPRPIELTQKDGRWWITANSL